MEHRAAAFFLAFLALMALARGAGAFVEVSNISVRPAAFSPNDDGVNDSTVVSFTTSSEAKSVSIYLKVVDAFQDTVAVLAGGEAYPTGSTEFTWRGEGAGGGPVAEGTYVFVLVAADELYTTPPYSASVRLDLTPPRFSAYLYPNPYAPDLPMEDSTLTVEIEVTGARGGDLLAATINTAEPPETLCSFSLPPVDSTYVCHWDGRDDEDGLYTIRIRTSDPAGNSSSASYAADLDLEAPETQIQSPAAAYLDYIPSTYWVTASDRNGVDSLKVRFYPGTEFMVPEGYPAAECCYPWPDSLRIEDEFELECMALDGVGHRALVARSVVVDTTAPARPSLAPLPARVGAPQLAVEGTGTALDSVRVYVNGATGRRGVISAAGTFTLTVTLNLGANTIYAVSKDRAGNVSPPSDAAAVEYTEARGIQVPEVFGADSRIEINLSREADRIHIRVISLEGSPVAEIVEDDPDLYNEIAWDLDDADGRQVKNGIYVFVIEILYADGSTEMEKKAVIISR